MFRYFFALSLLFFSFSAEAKIAKKKPQKKTISTSWTSSYAQWIDPKNGFVDYIYEHDQARVIFIGSSAYSPVQKGQRPSTSEGMGYGLLLAYAYNDQVTFDKFLRYTLATAQNYGCSLYDGSTQTCLAKAPLMMPWIVNETGMPFWYQSKPEDPSYYSSGSATDADIQIAWAISLASKRVKKGSWKKNKFHTNLGKLGYDALFTEMAKSIRLHDIDRKTVLYTPGSQWGIAGTEVLYPGYLTPQAFAALNAIAPPSISTACPTKLPSHTPKNSLQLTFINNTAHTLSIDYLGGSGDIKVDSHFIPKSGASKGYTVAPLTTAVAIFSSTDLDYANATIQATYYDEQGNPTMKSDYFYEYNDQVWTVDDEGSTSQSKSCLQKNVATVFLTQDDISDILFSFSTVATKSINSILEFQENCNTGLFPNVIYNNKDYPQNEWSNSYGYDACRFPLWVSSYVSKNPKASNTPSLKKALKSLLNSVTPFVKNGTLPSGGINALTQEPIGSWEEASPALNAPLYLAAKLTGDTSLATELEPSLLHYAITEHQPQTTDPEGDSSAYFNAAILLLTQALEKGLL